MNLASMDKKQLQDFYENEKRRYEDFKSKGLKLDMSRGKPSAAQLDISEPMLSVVSSSKDCKDTTGMDARNYGGLDGLPEAKKFFAEVFEVKEEQLFLGGNSSLNLMYDIISKGFMHGMGKDYEPWNRQGRIKFLCPSPGYDRHFSISESLGMELVAVPMLAEGPDMDTVERLVRDDAAIKGMWCVPKYSNPEGSTYSNEVVKRLAAMKTAAPDFRIMWDNAYAIHDLTDEPDRLLSLIDECERAGNPDRVLMFASTSKVTFPGGGVALLAASKKNIEYFTGLMFFQTIGYDKINQLRHVRFFKDTEGIKQHMKKHAEILRPKFDTVINGLKEELSDLGIASFIVPKGGYFISVDVMPGCARRTVALAKEAGVTMTGAGATYPYAKDPEDKNIRLAPTFPTLSELKEAILLFCICARLAAAEKRLSE